MRHTHSAYLLLVVLFGSLTAWADPMETRGKLDEVTVYRDQALVTRKIDLPEKAGLQEIVVTDLPAYILPESLYAEATGGIEVRSVRYRIRPVQQDVREEVRKLDEQIRDLQQKLQVNARYRQLSDEHKQYLTKLEQFTAPTANAELTRGVLNAETLKALSNYLLEQRKSVAEEELRLNDEQQKLGEKLQVVNRERDVLTGGSAKTVREAVVFVNVKDDDVAASTPGRRLRLGYLVSQASWSPSYSVRTDGKRKDVTVEYNAAIQQMSGEDWSDVAMTLSTATPSLVAKAPSLEPLEVTLSHMTGSGSGTVIARGNTEYFALKRGLQQQIRDLESQRGKAANRPAQQSAPNQPVDQQMDGPWETDGSGVQADDVFESKLNELANTAQVLDLLSQASPQAAKSERVAATEGVSVSYKLNARTALPSRSDRQLIQIASLKMPAEFYKVATPVLTSYVYEQASVTNNGRVVLLAGPVTTYSDGQFMGRSEMPTVAIGETFVVGFGIDASLRATRELASRTENIQGGNRVVDFTYELRVENFGSQPAHVRLLDRMPTGKETEIKLTLVSTGKPVSDDPTQTAKQKKGLLRWEVDVPPQSIGAKALKVDYKLQLEYDKQYTIAGLPTRK